MGGIRSIHYDNNRENMMKNSLLKILGEKVFSEKTLGSGLINFKGSAFIIDFDGRIYSKTNDCKRKFSNVYLIDPFEIIEGGESSSVNLLDRIDPNDEKVVSETKSLVDTIIIPSVHADPYWDEAAKELLVGLIIYVASLEDEERRNIGEVRRLLSSGEDVLNEALLAMIESPDLGFNIPARAANNFISKADTEGSCVKSKAVQHTGFLDDPNISQSLLKTDCDFRKIKDENMTVYLVMPPYSDMYDCVRFLQLMIGQVFWGATPLVYNYNFKMKVFLDEVSRSILDFPLSSDFDLFRKYG